MPRESVLLPDALLMIATRRQLKTISELQSIAKMCQQDFWNLHEYEEERRETQLKVMRKDYIVGNVVRQYNVIDELMSHVIVKHSFGGRNGRVNFKNLRRTKKYKAFKHNVLDRIYVLDKARWIGDIFIVPKDINASIYKLNDLRNALAHSFFPESRRAYAAANKVTFDNKDVFTLDGFAHFRSKMQPLVDFLFFRAFGVRFDHEEV